ncbi:MAG TPA: dephospho-CoA kinase, partial [Candidatus Altiarchaeales archaeon]|nr:dephospho-CoA kinase [Candidatus Altiarchaeales archaeon]
MKFVIGLTGNIGSGKTIVSEHIHNNYGASKRGYSQILM